MAAARSRCMAMKKDARWRAQRLLQPGSEQLLHAPLDVASCGLQFFDCAERLLGRLSLQVSDAAPHEQKVAIPHMIMACVCAMGVVPMIAVAFCVLFVHVCRISAVASRLATSSESGESPPPPPTRGCGLGHGGRQGCGLP